MHTKWFNKDYHDRKKRNRKNCTTQITLEIIMLNLPRSTYLNKLATLSYKFTSVRMTF